MGKSNRRTFSSQEKADLVRRHVIGKETVSDICEGSGVTPNQFYRWQQELFTNAEAAFEVKKRGRKANSKEEKLKEQVEVLEERLRQKDNVIAEVAEECLKTKKKLGLV